MRSRSCRILLLAVLAALVPFASPRPVLPVSQSRAVHAAAPGEVQAAGLLPLPSSCGRGLPGGSTEPACCMFGYVVIDGQAVAGAKVTISTSRGRAQTWTERWPDSPQPYFRISLSAAPLQAQAGETITIVGEYSGHIRTMTHTVLNGGQQVDVVLPRNGADDYVFDRQIWRQASPATLNFPTGIAIDPVGTVYVVDSDNARVQVYNRSGQFLQQWGTFGNRPGQFASPVGIAVDGAGNVLVADSANHRIQVFSGTGEWLRGWGSEGIGDGQFREPSGVAVDASGHVYVADMLNHRVQKFQGDGTFVTKWGTHGTGSGQFVEPNGIAVAANGDVYVADTENQRIQQFTSGGAFIRAWGRPGSSNEAFDGPQGLSVGPDGTVYVADTFNHRIQAFRGDGAFLRAWGTFGANDGQLYEPGSVTIDSDGNVYVADTWNHRIQVFRPDGGFVHKWGAPGSSDAQFALPTGVAIDQLGTVYVADTDNHRVQKLGPTDAFLLKWGTRGSGGTQFTEPEGIAVNTAGMVYVADTGNNRIQAFSDAGTFLSQWGTGGSAPGQFDNPEGVGVGKDGVVYVADTFNHRIQKFTGAGGSLGSWGREGSGIGQFMFPNDVAIAGDGTVYVADTDNHRVQQFRPNGTWLASWGDNGSGVGQFSEPRGVALDAVNNLYVADTLNYRIQKLSHGAWSASWGGRGNGPGEFIEPSRVAVDQTGHVYVADSFNNRIQVFRPMRFTLPIATIVAATPRSIPSGQPVELRGIGSDSDETGAIASYEWFVDNSATPFATTAAASLPTAGLSLGRHTIAFRVRDTEGQVSALQQIDIQVASKTSLESWTFLLYLAGDNGLTPFFNADSALGALYRLQHSRPNAQVSVAVLYDGDVRRGDSIRYLFRPTGQSPSQSVGEVNMGDPQTLIDFVRWGMQQAPASHYYLALADHANALSGIAMDVTAVPPDRLTNTEVRQALGTITDSGNHPIDVLHFDGCLMGLLENAYQMRGLAHYLIASENQAWSAFAYDAYRDAVGPATDPRTFATSVVDRYAQRVEDERDPLPYTLAALDLRQVNPVVAKLNSFADALVVYALSSPEHRTLLSSLRSQAQKFDSNDDHAITDDDEYVDLSHWTSLVAREVQDPAVRQAAQVLIGSLSSLVVYQRQRSAILDQRLISLDHAQGVAIYYPRRASATTYQTYRADLTFAGETHWDEFLAKELVSLGLNPSPLPPGLVAPLPLGSRIYVPLVRR